MLINDHEAANKGKLKGQLALEHISGFFKKDYLRLKRLQKILDFIQLSKELIYKTSFPLQKVTITM